MLMKKLFLRGLIAVPVLAMLVLITRVNATTIAQLDFTEVLETAELIFEGRVIHVEAQETGPRSIHTLVRFEILDVLKGDYSNQVLELRYLGGRVGTRELNVQAMQIPELGEHGFYFVESLQTPMVHPLVGWSQGHFLIETDAANQERVYTAEQEAVSDITTNLPPPSVNTAPVLGHDGSSRGVVIQGLSAPAPAMTVDRFRQIVRENLQGALP
jgi:hypothetical protein